MIACVALMVVLDEFVLGVSVNSVVHWYIILLFVFLFIWIG